jgi:2-oxoglutarate dehydrogenase E1 component
MAHDFDSHSLAFVEELYSAWLADPRSVSADWQHLFQGEHANGATRVGPSFHPASLFNPPGASPGAGRAPATAEVAAAELQDRLRQLVHAHRVRGHLIARLDPLDMPRPPCPELEPAFHGLTESDLERSVASPFGHGVGHGGQLTVRAVLERLRNTYCRSIGVQYMHIDDLGVKRWLQERMEGTENQLDPAELSHDVQIRILTKLTDAVLFEEFIQKKYLGAKSFSLEGSESLVPLLDLAIERAAADGIEEIVLGMAHRGRLNVLANVLGKAASDIFREFEDSDPELHIGRGDVKYHLGHSSDVHTTCGRTLHLSLCFNPSHLEFVNPVALGRLRAKQERFHDAGHERGMVILIHGDAAFPGEGVVQESLNLSELEAYTTGGTVHVIVNNQIGFTTRPESARSSTYCTEVARMLQVPIFHVNGEAPEAVAQVVKLAMDFRRTFRRDVVIDMYGYRRRGHNEGDEPSFTHPLMYQAIARQKPVREGYLEHLLALGNITREEADEIAARRREFLEVSLAHARGDGYRPPATALGGVWGPYRGGPEEGVEDVATGVDAGRLADLLRRTTRLPEGFHLHPKLARWMDARLAMAAGERPLDWSAGEALALATLSCEGTPIRLTGQDTERGTFSHRHAVLHDVENGKIFTPLAHLEAGQAPLAIHDSPLSETGVLGFEYGYSMEMPDGLTLWEAQFGDFVNVAQVILDQFICSAEDKWNRLSGLVLLLPHGFEGQGPEHSSARLERWLASAAQDNIQVINPTTPAQIFHALRRAVLRPWRKPLVVMTPKSLLRHPEAVAPLAELAQGTFQRVIADPRQPAPAGVRRVLLCSGKLYYDLDQARVEGQRDDVAILRLEQYYPLRDADIEAALAPYPGDVPLAWVQEEPENMGAWRFLHARHERVFGRRPFSGITRPASASPATGSLASHRIEQAALVERALDTNRRPSKNSLHHAR